MISKSSSTCLIFLLACLVAASPVLAGAAVQNLEVTADPSPVPDHVLSYVTPVKWDAVCLPIRFRINDTLDPIPNPLGPDFVTVDEVAAIIQEAADMWNDVPTSYVEIAVDGRVSNPGTTGFDQINEVSFRTGGFFAFIGARTTRGIDFGAVSYVRTTTLLQRSPFPADLDLDGDGDSDVSDAITECADVDGDGDTEYPALTYDAGTLFDTDIVFSTGESTADPAPRGYRFTVDAGDIDDDPDSVDLLGVAIQALATTQGVAHSATNQRSKRDGSESPLFPLVDFADPAGQMARRSLDTDAAVTTSMLYPEGSASEGPAALQPGDFALDQVYGFIEGEIHLGETGDPVIGANVFATDVRTGEIVSTAISGTTLWSTMPNGFGSVFIDADFHALNGNYRLIVPPGTYTIGVEAVDSYPIDHAYVNLDTITAFNIGQDRFEEDFYNGALESDAERRPGKRVPVTVGVGEVVGGIDIITNRTISLGSFGSFDSMGFDDAQSGSYYAVRIPGEELTAALAEADEPAVIHGPSFLTGSAKTSDVPVFARALVTTGRVKENGVAIIDLDEPLVQKSPFIGQDFDFTTLYVNGPVGLTRSLEKSLAEGTVTDLFLVLQVSHEGPVAMIGLDGGIDENDEPIHGRSYVSRHGRSFTPVTDYNFMFKLVLGIDE